MYEAQRIPIEEETFCILDGHDAKDVPCQCLTLFISSPCDYFRSWLDEAMITSSYFPVWTLDGRENNKISSPATLSSIIL